jgi:rod shape-determining protein MreC
VRNVFLFIRRYFNFVFFLLLQIIALMMLFRYNKYHEAAFMGVASEITGSFDARYNTIENFLRLKKTNEQLAAENERLKNLLRQDFAAPDSSRQIAVDSIRIDSLEQYRKYLYLSAKVIGNSTSSQTNYITIHRGSAQGVQRDMAVLSGTGVVGTVVNVSKNMASVMSILHRQSRISASLLRSGETGTVEWDGKDPQFVTLRNIPRSVQVYKGDTIITSKYSDKFPPGQFIGFVDDVVNESGSSFYSLKIRTATNFFNVQYVNVVAKQDQLEKATQQKQ